MKHFVIDIDENDSFVRVMQVTQEFNAEGGDRGVAYHRSSDANSVLSAWVDKYTAPKFYGRLHAILPLKSRIDAAEPIEIESQKIEKEPTK